MPPRRRRQQADAQAAPEASLPGLPPDVLQVGPMGGQEGRLPGLPPPAALATRHPCASSHVTLTSYADDWQSPGGPGQAGQPRNSGSGHCLAGHELPVSSGSFMRVAFLTGARLVAPGGYTVRHTQRSCSLGLSCNVHAMPCHVRSGAVPCHAMCAVVPCHAMPACHHACRSCAPCPRWPRCAMAAAPPLHHCWPPAANSAAPSLHMTRSALNALAKGTLWWLLGEEYPEEGATTAKALAAVPKQASVRWAGQARGGSWVVTCRQAGRRRAAGLLAACFHFHDDCTFALQRCFPCPPPWTQRSSHRAGPLGGALHGPQQGCMHTAVHVLMCPSCDVSRPPRTPLQDRWDARHLTSNTRKLKNYTAAKALARQYAEVGLLQLETAGNVLSWWHGGGMNRSCALRLPQPYACSSPSVHLSTLPPRARTKRFWNVWDKETNAVPTCARRRFLTRCPPTSLERWPACAAWVSCLRCYCAGSAVKARCCGASVHLMSANAPCAVAAGSLHGHRRRLLACA